jgi:hypothetical protein
MQQDRNQKDAQLAVYCLYNIKLCMPAAAAAACAGAGAWKHPVAFN